MDIAIKAERLSKIYKIYEQDIDRLKEAFHKRYSRGRTLAELATEMQGEISQFKL